MMGFFKSTILTIVVAAIAGFTAGMAAQAKTKQAEPISGKMAAPKSEPALGFSDLTAEKISTSWNESLPAGAAKLKLKGSVSDADKKVLQEYIGEMKQIDLDLAGVVLHKDQHAYRDVIWPRLVEADKKLNQTALPKAFAKLYGGHPSQFNWCTQADMQIVQAANRALFGPLTNDVDNGIITYRQSLKSCEAYIGAL